MQNKDMSVIEAVAVYTQVFEVTDRWLEGTITAEEAMREIALITHKEEGYER